MTRGDWLPGLNGSAHEKENAFSLGGHFSLFINRQVAVRDDDGVFNEKGSRLIRVSLRLPRERLTGWRLGQQRASARGFFLWRSGLLRWLRTRLCRGARKA